VKEKKCSMNLHVESSGEKINIFSSQKNMLTR
jgi:hypothetical protein